MKGDLGAVHCFEGKGQGDPDSECWHHQYYQWVALVLVFQAGCFYFPRCVLHSGVRIDIHYYIQLFLSLQLFFRGVNVKYSL